MYIFSDSPKSVYITNFKALPRFGRHKNPSSCVLWLYYSLAATTTLMPVWYRNMCSDKKKISQLAPNVYLNAPMSFYAYINSVCMKWICIMLWHSVYIYMIKVNISRGAYLYNLQTLCAYKIYGVFETWDYEKFSLLLLASLRIFFSRRDDSSKEIHTRFYDRWLR